MQSMRGGLNLIHTADEVHSRLHSLPHLSAVDALDSIPAAFCHHLNFFIRPVQDKGPSVTPRTVELSRPRP